MKEQAPGVRSDAINETSLRSVELRDFSTTWRVLPISVLALLIGVVAAYVAVALLKLIGFFTNLFFFQTLSTEFRSPAAAVWPLREVSIGHHLGWLAVFVPIIGGIIVGLMARFGSDKIRGHGIPEAIEAILLRGARVEPRVAVLKPISAAVAIGSGGPFGAEGPIIMTGGAFGSLIAQFFHLTNAERKTLLVAGAAAGMSATFAAPFAAVLLAVELLLFEWKPRSFIPVVFASVAAEAARIHLLGPGPIFPVPAHEVTFSPAVMFGCLLTGVLAGALAALLSNCVYGVEDGFAHLKKIHWMWWPAIGGAVVGIGGLIYPRALGVGYDVIGDLLKGNFTLKLILGVLLVKSVIWAVSLGSGTSGGVLAPLLMMGGSLGALEALFLPNQGMGFWPLISMGAILSGALGAPLTGVIFAFELTSDYHSIFPLLIACMAAHAFTALTLPRSILTEKLSRRGQHLTREYVVDPMEVLAVQDVMRTSISAFPAESTLAEVRNAVDHPENGRGQRVYPVIDRERRLVGVVTRGDLANTISNLTPSEVKQLRLADLVGKEPLVAYPEEPLRVVVNRMATTQLTRFPVVKQGNDPELLGMVAIEDLLRARELSMEEEHHRERVLRLRIPASLRWRGPADKKEEPTHKVS
ncbi:MAG TPA: chloride channel protein [Candidatus Angelobacter sp.]|jgi:CIC family chloride channel protein|nr:chloride channel protein [Candidatus Angelobacter sp.]